MTEADKLIVMLEIIADFAHTFPTYIRGKNAGCAEFKFIWYGSMNLSISLKNYIKSSKGRYVGVCLKVDDVTNIW